MLGQEKFEKFVKDTKQLPKVIKLTGNYGSEFDEAVKLIADTHGLFLLDITDADDYNEAILSACSPTLFIIKCGYSFDRRKQNRLLKVLEDMPTFSNIVLVAEYGSTILRTLSNRSVELKLACVNSSKYCHTVGQEKELGGYNIEELEKLCDNIIINIGKADYCNMLKVADKLNFSNEEEKYPIWLFYNVYARRCYDIMIDKDTDAGRCSLIMEPFFLEYLNMGDKKAFFVYFLSKVWAHKKGYEGIWTLKN